MTPFELAVARFPNPRIARPRFTPLAAGGDLRPLTLIAAYSLGIFPWYNSGDPILWWSPHPRCALYPANFSLPRRSIRYLRKSGFSVSVNQCFERVIDACSEPRDYSDDTWITPEMRDAYVALHELGYAHSIETWLGDELVGGLYGVVLGKVFYGESMFHWVSEASRAASLGLATLAKRSGFKLIDCQQTSDLVLSMGAAEMPRSRFLTELAADLAEDKKATYSFCPWDPWRPGPWRERVENLLKTPRADSEGRANAADTGL